jgi:hypothetical protein
MRTKHDRKDLEKILRRRGAQQTADVSPSVTEIRSCGVMGTPEPIPPGSQGVLAGLVIMWEFSVQFDQLRNFHDFLASDEDDLVAGMPNLDPGARYLGTYILHTGGTPRYRTIWAYSSLELMRSVWAAEVKRDGPMAAIVTKLRMFWLRDPHRSEARWIPAKKAMTEKDAFAELTIRAATALAM